MKFGLCLPNYGPATSPAAIRDVAQAAEAAGYDSVWSTDHILVPEEHAPVFGNTIEALTTLAYLAGITERLTLATSILVLPQRDPILVAKQAAAIDLLSGGRLILGIGAGWMEGEFNYMRAPFRQRGRMTDEWIDVMRALWRGDTDFDGRGITFHDAIFRPLPRQPGGPPIYVGGNSDAALRRTVERGDGWHPTAIGPQPFATGAAYIRQHTTRPIPLSLRNTVQIGGPPPEQHQTPRGPRQPLSGPPSAIVDTLATYADAGLDHLVCYFRHQTATDLFDQLNQFATTVIPHFANNNQ